MAKITLTYDQAHSFVEKNKSNGFFWDNYTIIKFSPHKAAYTDKNGIFKNNKWGFANRYDLKQDGTWDISDKYARFI
ncbi:hypothetical protein UFOVP204_93 [uncultured Caudovirales phage]|uniref:Uncharacterized protein n=1 Tax=uncultured Caudovirales phage TaxID=2100421 RepID=A0A6J7WJP9_9CAUD|nr:hypothetical protein UFOVP204_93 [uncultured Caudovirales phage]